MISYVEAPNIVGKTSPDAPLSLFLAGGISGCPDWQAEILKKFEESTMGIADQQFVVMSPRRANFPIHDPTAAEAQIKWEFDHLRAASAILFWFPEETLCPIVLYELGAWSRSRKPIFVGCHPNYKRKQDVEIQTKLVRPDITVVYSLDDLAQQAIAGMASVCKRCIGEVYV